jgi:ribose transport system permease protein
MRSNGSNKGAVQLKTTLQNIYTKVGGPVWGLLLLVIVLSIVTDVFLTYANLINVVRQVVIISIMAIGATFVIIGGGIDLSVGSVLAFCGAIGAKTMFVTGSAMLSILTTLAVGACIGLFHGVLVTKGDVPPFAATLGGMAIFRGLTLIYTNGLPISGLPKSFRFLGSGYVGPVPAPIVCVIVVFGIGYILLNRTRLGRYIYAMGSNEQATRLTGVKVDLYRTVTYIISGVSASLAGIVLTGRINSAHPQAGIGYELEAIAATVIGGTSLAGGEGQLYGTLIGALLIGIIRNGLNLLHVSAYYQEVTVGIVIVLAVLFDRSRQKSK